jgi:hypothetical protein
VAKRECSNWLDSFVSLHKDTSPAPISFLEWSGLFCISSVTKRKIEFSREYLKTFRIYPNIYVIFIAKPGALHKSTTAGLAMEVVQEMLKGMLITDPAYINLGQTSGSYIGILESLAESMDGSVSIVASEFGTLTMSTPIETYTFLCELFDSDKVAEKYKHKTRHKGTESISNPSVNILGCTTPSWITENSGFMTGGGFAARVVFVFEEKTRYRRLFSKDVGPTLKEQDAIRAKLAKDLRLIGKIKGQAKPENKAVADEIEAWYQKIENFKGEKGTETFQARKHVHVLRNAMLLSLCERDDLIITQEHFLRARAQIEEVESRLGKGMAILGRNPYSGMLFDVLEYIRESGPVDRGKLMARFWTEFEKNPDQDLTMILETLKAMGEVKERTTGTKTEWLVAK